MSPESFEPIATVRVAGFCSGDVLAYRERRRQRQYAMLEATAIDLDNEDDPLEVIERLRAARKAVAEQQVQ